MGTHYLEKIDDTTRRIIKDCYPEYTGKKVKISTDIPTELRSYWDGGSRNYYVIYCLADGRTLSVGSNHPMFEENNSSILLGLPTGYVIVSHSFYCGKDIGITIYANKADLVPLLSEVAELTKNELIVLTFTAGYKASYGGRSDLRFYEANRVHGISKATWQTTKDLLISKGLLAKNGSITANGRNAIADKRVNM